MQSLRMKRRHRKAFLSDQCKEIEETNRRGKTRDFKRIRDTKETFHAKIGSTKDRKGMNLTKAADIKKCWSFNGLEPGGPESKREKEAGIPWLTWKANRALFLGLALLHGGTRRPLKWVEAQCAFSRGA